MEKSIKSKFISSAALLLVSSLIVKVISAVYKIPLTTYIGATGRGYFTTAYNLYMPFHAIIMGAFPIAVSHFISKYTAKKDKEKVLSIKKAANRLFFLVGVLGLALMLLISKPYAEFVSTSSKSLYTIYVLAPSVFFSALAASYRSFAEGNMNMVPTAISQVIEALFKMIFGLLFARYSMSYLYSAFLKTGMVLNISCKTELDALAAIYPLTSAAAMAGVTVGSFVSLIYVYLSVNLKYNSFPPLKNYKVGDSLKELFSFSVPIIISTAIQSVSMFLDNASVQYFLTLCNKTELMNAYKNSLAISMTKEEDVVTYIYGILSTAQDFKNLLPGFAMALGVASVPAISAAMEGGDRERLSNLINSIFKYTSIIAFGGGFYLSLMSANILKLFYASSNYDIVIGAEKVLEYFGFTMIFYCLSSVAVFAVQSIGFAKKSILSFIISAVLRILINYFVVSNAKYNIFGTVLSGMIGYFIILVANMNILKKNAKIKYKMNSIIIKPLFCSIIPFFFVKFFFSTLLLTNNNILDFILLSFIYLATFTGLLLLSKTIELSEFYFIHNCKKLA